MCLTLNRYVGNASVDSPPVMLGFILFSRTYRAGNGSSVKTKFVMNMILRAMSITFISTQLNTGTYNVRLTGLIRHFTVIYEMGYMRMTGLLRWKARCSEMIDADRVGTKPCPRYLIS